MHLITATLPPNENFPTNFTQLCNFLQVWRRSGLPCYHTSAAGEKRTIRTKLFANQLLYPPLSNHFIAQNRVQSLQPSLKDFTKNKRFYETIIRIVTLLIGTFSLWLLISIDQTITMGAVKGNATFSVGNFQVYQVVRKKNTRRENKG